MRKKFTILAFAVSMLTAGNLFAQDYYEHIKTMNIYSTDEFIEIDGVANESCWSAAEVTENAIDVITHDWGVEPVPNIWGYEASFKAVYDKRYVYFFIKIKDNTYIPYDEALKKSDTGVDNIELFFFPDPEGRDEYHSSIDARGRGHSQLRMSVGSEDNRATGGGYAGGRIVNNKLTGYEYKTVRTAEGYNIEGIVPWSEVIPEGYEGNLEVGKKILFDINAANCTDYDSNTRVVILGWSGEDHNAWRWNAELGEMLFMGPLGGSTAIAQTEISNVNYTFVNGVLSLQNADNLKVDICDIAGKTVKSLTYTQAVDLSDLQSGVYIVNVAGRTSIKIIK